MMGADCRKLEERSTREKNRELELEFSGGRQAHVNQRFTASQIMRCLLCYFPLDVSKCLEYQWKCNSIWLCDHRSSESFSGPIDTTLLLHSENRGEL
jgi:hypothetical protein